MRKEGRKEGEEGVSEEEGGVLLYTTLKNACNDTCVVEVLCV